MVGALSVALSHPLLKQTVVSQPMGKSRARSEITRFLFH